MQKIIFLLLLILTACAPAVNTPTPLILTSTSPAPIETITLTPTRTAVPTETPTPTPESVDLNVSCAAPEAVAKSHADFPAIFRANMTAFLESQGITVSPDDPRVNRTIAERLAEHTQYPAFQEVPARWYSTFYTLEEGANVMTVNGVLSGVQVLPLSEDVPNAPEGSRQICLYVDTENNPTMVIRIGVIDINGKVTIINNKFGDAAPNYSLEIFSLTGTSDAIVARLKSLVGRYIFVGFDMSYKNGFPADETVAGVKNRDLFPYLSSNHSGGFSFKVVLRPEGAWFFQFSLPEDE